MAQEIRLRVWLIGIPPILVVAALAGWLVFGLAGSKPAARHAPLASLDPLPSQPANPASTPPVPHAPLPVATPATTPLPAATVLAASAPATASSGGAGGPPEPIPELDELRPPADSDGWTEDQKAAYRQKVLDDLAARERRLKREIAAAHQAGDARTEQEKADTLAYLQTRVADVERLLAAARAKQALSDAGS